MNDPINHPSHYTQHPSGVECITITEHMGFNLGNALKYIWRADLKDNAEADLLKAIWYLERELAKRGTPRGIKYPSNTKLTTSGDVLELPTGLLVSEAKLPDGIAVADDRDGNPWLVIPTGRIVPLTRRNV